jgi:hypothetical protein
MESISDQKKKSYSLLSTFYNLKLKYIKINFYEKRIGKSSENISTKGRLTFLSYEQYKETFFYKAECDEEYKKRFNRNDLCAALFAPNIVNVSWISSKPVFIDEIEMELPDLIATPLNCNGVNPLQYNKRVAELVTNDGIIIYDVITKLTERGKGYYSEVLNLIANWAATQGYKKITIYSEAKNKSSIKGITKAGFEYTKSIRMFKAFKYKLYF